MHCPDRAPTVKIVRIGCAGLLAGALGACGTTLSSSDIGSSTKLGNLLAFNSTSAPPLPAAPGLQPSETCPEVVVLEGSAARRVFAGAQSAESLRYQISLNDVARQCFVQGGQLSIKVGIEGRVLLGAAGTPGTFTVPVRLAVVNEKTQAPVLSKVYRINATVPAGQSAAEYNFLTEPLVVPNISDHSDDDYSIKLAIEGEGAADGEKPVRRRKRT